MTAQRVNKVILFRWVMVERSIDRSITHLKKSSVQGASHCISHGCSPRSIALSQRQWRYSYAGDNVILRVDQGVEKMRVNCVFRILFVLTHHSSMYLQVKKWCIFL